MRAWNFLVVVLVAALIALAAAAARAQAPAAPDPAAEKRDEQKPATFRDEIRLFSYVEMGSTTLTFHYKIWRGLVSRLEYRHDQADERAFRKRYDKTRTLVPTSRSMDTISLSAYYLFF